MIDSSHLPCLESTFTFYVTARLLQSFFVQATAINTISLENFFHITFFQSFTYVFTLEWRKNIKIAFHWREREREVERRMLFPISLVTQLSQQKNTRVQELWKDGECLFSWEIAFALKCWYILSETSQVTVCSKVTTNESRGQQDDKIERWWLTE